jgi:hypothetical protein
MSAAAIFAEAERLAIDWVRRKRPVSFTADLVVSVNIEQAVGTKPLVSVRLSDLERKGYVERWSVPEGWCWTLTDQPPSFQRPHWRAETIEADQSPSLTMVRVFADVGDHPMCWGSFMFPFHLAADDKFVANELRHTIKAMQQRIAEDCGCGGGCNEN